MKSKPNRLQGNGDCCRQLILKRIPRNHTGCWRVEGWACEEANKEGASRGPRRWAGGCSHGDSFIVPVGLKFFVVKSWKFLKETETCQPKIGRKKEVVGDPFPKALGSQILRAWPGLGAPRAGLQHSGSRATGGASRPHGSSRAPHLPLPSLAASSHRGWK